MLNMKKTAVATALLFATGAVNAAAVTSLEITGGDFFMAGAGGPIAPGAHSVMTIGGYDGAEPTAAATAAVYAPDSIGTFTFGFFGDVAIRTAENDGVNFGFAPVTGDLTGNALSLDLSSWTAYWNGTSFNQGGVVAATTDGAGNFTASWDALVVGGAFDGQIGGWTITGNASASAVPVPAAAWLFGSGLLGLVGIARRRRAA